MCVCVYISVDPSRGEVTCSFPASAQEGPASVPGGDPERGSQACLQDTLLTLWSFMSLSWMPSIQECWQLGQMCFLFWCLRGGRKRGLEFGVSRRLFRTSDNSAGTESEGELTEPTL